jgi:hypothetical protein
MVTRTLFRDERAFTTARRRARRALASQQRSCEPEPLAAQPPRVFTLGSARDRARNDDVPADARAPRDAALHHAAASSYPAGAPRGVSWGRRPAAVVGAP